MYIDNNMRNAIYNNGTQVLWPFIHCRRTVGILANDGVLGAEEASKVTIYPYSLKIMCKHIC